MKAGRRSTTILALALVALSVALYLVNYALFHDARVLYFYSLLDLAFIPIQILLVSLIINRLLALREKTALLDKLNMVIGVFFSEVGTSLIRHLNSFDADFEAIRPALLFRYDWENRDFTQAARALVSAEVGLNCRNCALEPVQEFLCGKREFLLSLLGNPNLLEHERFTQTLWAVFHLMEELAFRSSLTGLPASDLDHLTGDMHRAYTLLLAEWLEHLRHLRSAYPYLYSLAVRTNPFDPDAHVEVTP